VSKKLKQVVEKFMVMNLFLGVAIACGVGIFALAKFAISAPNSAVAEFAIGMCLLLMAIGGGAFYLAISFWNDT